MDSQSNPDSWTSMRDWTWLTGTMPSAAMDVVSNGRPTDLCLDLCLDDSADEDMSSSSGSPLASLDCLDVELRISEQNLSDKVPATPGHHHHRSFLHDEMDEFERVLSELLLSPNARSSPSTPPTPALGPASRWASFDRVVDDFHREASSHNQPSATTGRQSFSPGRSGRVGCPPSTPSRSKDASCPESCDSRVPRAFTPDKDDKLFSDLLDDVDNISTTPVRQRRKARDLFSDWLFSDSPVSLNDRPMLRHASRRSSKQSTKRRSADFTDFVKRQVSAGLNRWRPRSMEVHSEVIVPDDGRLNTLPCAFSATDCQYTCHHKCRPLISVDCQSPDGQQGAAAAVDELTTCDGQEKAQTDDADSGYHTGGSTLRAVAAAARSNGATSAAVTPPPSSASTDICATREDLREKIQAFNNNNHGLIMTLASDEGTMTFQGFIRVYLNLIHPVNMSLSMETEQGETTQMTSFYLPKNTSKVVHINSDTSIQEVISALLSKFKITDNPRKYVLYEQITGKDNKATMHKLNEGDRPLPLCLSWTAEGLDVHKFVLHENDTGEIMWEAFSLPELENFLKILNREESEYIKQLKARYNLAKIQIQMALKDMPQPDDQREPVYV